MTTSLPPSSFPPDRHPATDAPAFLRDGGEMGELMRRHDWSGSSLGPPETWPQSLRSMVRLMLNTGHPMYIWWGPEGACLYNDAYRQTIGPERHPSSLGRPAREVWDEIWDIIGPQIQQVRDGRGATWNVNQLVPITRHGRREDVYWTYSYSPIDDEHSANGIGGVLVVCTETTAEVLANQRMAAERDQLGLLFEQAPAFMALLSGPNHRFEIANPSYLRLVGNRDLIGRTVAEALPDAVAQGYQILLDSVYASGEAYIAKGAKFISSGSAQDGGAERFVDFVYQPIKGMDGSVTGIFVEGADVTDRERASAGLRASEAKYRELAETLAESNRKKDEFLATLAHELRNPLAPIRNALALQRHASDNPRILESSRRIIERQVEQMVRLIDDLRQAVETSRPAVEQAGHRLLVHLPERDCVISADETRIIQVLTNLINNASKFTPRGGTIEVGLRCDGGVAALSVRDDGIGIPEDMLHRVFDMFTQVHRSHAHVGGGLGIGLTLVRQLVEQHGGYVEARSAGVDRGSEFIVRLPAGATASSSEESAEPARARFTASGLRVLVADDHADVVESLSLLLQLAGHEVRAARSGTEAFEIAEAFRPDAMLVDIAMPGLDGHQLSRKVRATPWGRGALLIAASGWGQADDKQRSAEAGFDHHLVKPVDFHVVDSLLAERRRPPS